MTEGDLKTLTTPPAPHEVLKSRRLEKGLSLEKVREDTKISPRYLLALEEGRYGVFPALVYLRGFFLSYAKYLELPDSDDLFSRVTFKGANNGAAFAAPLPRTLPKTKFSLGP